jgi:uncharacterized membrane protein YciS (DUF1049 family)
MHPAGKIIVGLILLVIGLGLFANGIIPGFNVAMLGTFWLNTFIAVLQGIIPILLILLGLFIVWLEVDELKAQKELKKEE